MYLLFVVWYTFSFARSAELSENGLMVKVSGAVTDVSIKSARERI